MTGFKGRSGRSFRARLALMQTEDGKWRVEFDEPWAREGAKPPEGEEAAPTSAPAARRAPERQLRRVGERARSRTSHRHGRPPPDPTSSEPEGSAFATARIEPTACVDGPRRVGGARGREHAAHRLDRRCAAPPRRGASRRARARAAS